jgi:hypothetical protein
VGGRKREKRGNIKKGLPTRPPPDEEYGAQESIEVPLRHRQCGEPGPPAGDGNGKRGKVDECFRARAGRVQDEESGIACPDERRGFPPDERGSVERISDDFGKCPGEHHTRVEWAMLGLF